MELTHCKLLRSHDLSCDTQEENKYTINLPAIALSGSGGTGMQMNFSFNLSCNQSKCLYRLLTCI
jgi:hypothetical protein